MLLLRQFKELYKELYNLPINRYWFENFYSTSTSTIMSIADVLYGDVSKFDKTVSFDNLIDGDWSIKSICKSNRKSRALFYPNF